MSASKVPSAEQGRSEVDRLLASIVHPESELILAARALLRESSPEVSEGVKWNAPSFRSHEWFATVDLRAKQGVRLILHLGAKVRAGVDARTAVEDPRGALTWLAADRALLTIRDPADLAARREALLALLRQWLRLV